MKNEIITVRVEEKVKNKLIKIAKENERELSDFVRLILNRVADGKIKL